MPAKAKKNAKAKTWNPILPVYGELWRKDLVDWRGKKGKARHFLLPGKVGKEDIEMSDQVGVYILYDDNHVPIYIGQAGGREWKKRKGEGGNRLFWRLRSHALGAYADRWKYFSWFGLKTINKNGGLRKFKRRGANLTQIIDALEAAMIAASDPRLNSHSGHLSGATRVKQGTATASDPTEQRLNQIEQKLDELLDD
jgi:hypothetical protein